MWVVPISLLLAKISGENVAMRRSFDNPLKKRERIYQAMATSCPDMTGRATVIGAD